MVKKQTKKSKNSTAKKEFYNPIISSLKQSTNLTKIQENLNISKQQLNYYLRRLKENGFIIQKGRGWWEVTDKSKNSTHYEKNLKKDLIRGHAYIWKIKISKQPKNWDKRIEILEKNKINYKLVGILKNTPRIKVYGRKVWLCNRYLRIWEKKGKSFYGDNAIESKHNAFNEIKIVLQALENKLNINLRPYLIQVKREHYALIKNDLAIYHNERGEILRVRDKDGEWLLIDDSLEMGGELENIGKKALPESLMVQKWWNDNKKNNFEVTPTFTLKGLNQLTNLAKQQQSQIQQVTNNQLLDARNIIKHQKVLDEMLITLKLIQKDLKK